MPKEITHWILAERALERLGGDSRLAEIIRGNHALYLAGTVLPDTLLHLFRGPHCGVALDLAHRFHDTGGNSFAPLIRAETAHATGLPPGHLACLLGVISHIQTDSLFHPYVYSLSGVTDIGLHYRLETAIDVHFLRHGVKPPARRFAELVTPENGRLLVDAIALLFDPEGRLPRSALEHALELHGRFQGMYDRFWWKVAACLLGALLGSPFREQRQLFYPFSIAGAGHLAMIDAVHGWKHPVTAESRTSSLDDLAEETVQQTVAVFRLIDERGSLSAALADSPGANLLTGLHGVGMSEMKIDAPERSDG